MASALLLEGIADETTLGFTENGADTFTSTLNKNLDFFAMASAKRNDPDDAVRLFLAAYQEDPGIALLNLFYCRDVRGGQGERTIFRLCLEEIEEKYLVNEAFLKLIPEYGRWDDLIMLLSKFEGQKNIAHTVVKIIADQIAKDLVSDHPSLCAKWVPLGNCVSNQEKKRVAKILVSLLQMTERNWRKMITPIRQKLNLVETNLTEKDYHSIEYGKLPSRAFNKYKKAFVRNDENRFNEFLAAVQKGEAKINANCIYPYEIVSQIRQKISNISWGFDPRRAYNLSREELTTFTEMWKALPAFNIQGNVLTVVDVSGSMFTQISSSSNALAVDVSTSLGIYTSEHNTGIFKNNYISFSERPQLISLNSDFSIVDKLKYIYTTDAGLNTNIQAVFDCILNAMTTKHVPAEECPSIILMISDMEFDEAQSGGWATRRVTNYDAIRGKYSQHGYKMPQLVFWNVMSRNDNVPVRKNENGVVLISGMSPAILRFISEGEINPEKFMMNVLNSERYNPVREAISE